MATALDPLYHVLAFIINVLDYILGFRTHIELANEVKSVEVEPPQRPGESGVHRAPDLVGKDLDAHTSRLGRTMAELCEMSCKKFYYRVAFAWRPVLEVRQMGKSRSGTTLTVVGRPRQMTFNQFYEKVVAYGSGLVALGMQPGDVLALYEETCVDWLAMAHAAWRMSIQITTVYANLGENALTFALKQTEAKAVFMNAKQVSMVAQQEGLFSLSAIIYREKLETVVPSSKRVLAVEELEKLGLESPSASSFPNPEDVACIMYTSGTTGDPKGVLITHRNMAAAVTSMLNRMGLGDDLAGEPTALFLPLAHIYSLVVTHTGFAGGGLAAIGSAATLTDTFTQPHGDLREFQPTMFVAVPRVFDIFKKTIEARLVTRPPLAQFLFHSAYEARKKALARGRDTPLWNYVVFKPIRHIFGGKLKVIFSGGAPLNPKTQEFIRLVLGASMEQGYGLTETTACLTVQYKHDLSLGNVGAVHDPCEVKLVDIPEMGYTTANKSNQCGEIVVRGPVITSGYYKLPDITAEVFLEGGWFATGDVGRWLPSGALAIIDRKKNLVKLANGEYVALEKLESTYCSSPFIMPNGICCIAHPDKSFVVAVILLNKEMAFHIARQKGWSSDPRTLLKHPELKRVVQESLDKEADSAQLSSFERVKRFRLYDDMWTPETGLMTAAMKLLRRNIEAHYRDDITALYA